jgi:preprotein translocase subunit SecD
LTDDGLRQLADLLHLEYLDLRFSVGTLSEAGVTEFRAQKPGCQVLFQPVAKKDSAPPSDSAAKFAPKPGVKVEFRRAENQPGEGLTEAAVAGTTQKIYLHASVDVTNADIAEARAALDSQQKPVVEITFTEEGAKKMAKLTAEHQNTPLAILVDGKVVCAPVLRATIFRKARITGNFTQEEVDRIVRGINGRQNAAD